MCWRCLTSFMTKRPPFFVGRVRSKTPMLLGFDKKGVLPGASSADPSSKGFWMSSTPRVTMRMGPDADADGTTLTQSQYDE